MIKICKCEVFGWEAAIRGMRNPMESWEKSDTVFSDNICDFSIGKNDLTLMKKLARAGSDHAKYLRMIVVYADITAPLYWWKEFDTYKIGTVANSCSTMHKIGSKPFELDDFSYEHLFGTLDLEKTIKQLNGYLLQYKSCGKESYPEYRKNVWWQMIQTLPSSYNQLRTVMLNYEVLRRMYRARKDHKLDEWVDFCKWAETLPYFMDIISSDDTKGTRNED